LVVDYPANLGLLVLGLILICGPGVDVAQDVLDRDA